MLLDPFKISLRLVNTLRFIHKSFTNNEFSKMSCYAFFGKITRLCES